MHNATARLISNLPAALSHFSIEQLYQLARGLGNELVRRELDAHLEARALELALLVPAQQEHRSRLVDGDLTVSDVHVDAGRLRLSDLGLWADRPSSDSSPSSPA